MKLVKGKVWKRTSGALREKRKWKRQKRVEGKKTGSKSINNQIMDTQVPTSLSFFFIYLPLNTLRVYLDKLFLRKKIP